MSKAYDRVEWFFAEWFFLKNMMSKMGFPDSWTNLVTRCVFSVSYSVMINSCPSVSFYPTRGLQQGNPLSPYLFLICTKSLSVMIRNAEFQCGIHGMKVCKQTPLVSHLFFANGIVLFTKA